MLLPSSRTSFHHLRPTSSLPVTFLTVQKSKASSSTQTTKPMMNESNSSTDSRYSTMAAALNST